MTRSSTALAAALAVSLAATPMMASAQTAPVQNEPIQVAPAPVAPAPVAVAPAATSDRVFGIDRTLLAAGAGAIVGIVAFNVLTVPLGTVPLAGAALAAVPYDVALGSRLLAALSGGAGALLAGEAYNRLSDDPRDLSYVAALGVGALGGIAVGNLLAGSIGYIPYYEGAGQSLAVTAGGYASSAAQAASRIHVIASGVMGAWVADYLYGVQ